MPYRRLFRYDVVLIKAKSGTETERIPIASATVLAFKPGAWTQGSGNDNAGAGATITVHNRHNIIAGDLVTINSVAGNSRTVSSVTATTIVLAAGGSGAFSWADGDRVMSPSGVVTMYTDDQGVETTGTVVSSAQGVAQFYSKRPVVDISITDGSTTTAQYEIAGAAQAEDVTPEEFGATRDGTTDDRAAFAAALTFLKDCGGGVLQLGVGSYRLNTNLDIDFSNLVIRGRGRGVTEIRTGFSGSALFNLTGTISDVTIERMSVTGMTGTPQVVAVGTTVSRASVKDLILAGVTYGVVDSGADTRVEDLISTSTILISLYRGLTAKRPHLTRLTHIASNDPLGVVIDIDTDCEAVRMTGVDVYCPTPSGRNVPCLKVHKDGAGTNPPRDVVIVASKFIAGTLGTAAQVTNTEGLQFIGCQLSDSKIAYDIDGGKSIKILGGSIVGIQQGGIDIDGGSHIRIVEVESSDVGIQTTSTYDHVNIASGVDDVSIMGMTVGNFIRASANKANWGVNIVGGLSDRIQVLGLRGVIADLGSGYIFNSSTSREIDIGHNIEFGSNRSYTHTSVPASNANVSPFTGTLRLTDATTQPDVKNVSHIIHTPSSNVVYAGMDNAQDGQVVTITNLHATNTITFNSGGTFKTSGGASRVLGQYDSISFLRLATEAIWVEAHALVAAS